MVVSKGIPTEPAETRDPLASPPPCPARKRTRLRWQVGKSLGFVGCKVPCPYGPADGQEGFAKNVKYLKQCREADLSGALRF